MLYKNEICGTNGNDTLEGWVFRTNVTSDSGIVTSHSI